MNKRTMEDEKEADDRVNPAIWIGGIQIIHDLRTGSYWFRGESGPFEGESMRLSAKTMETEIENLFVRHM